MDNKGIAPIVAVGVIILVILAAFACLVIYNMTSSDSIYPEGKNPADARGYATGILDLYITFQDGVRDPLIQDGGDMSLYLGKPEVDVIGIKMPDLLAQVDSIYTLVLTVTYPNGDVAEKEYTFIVNPDLRTSQTRSFEMDPVLFFDTGSHRFVGAVYRGNPDTGDLLWESSGNDIYIDFSKLSMWDNVGN